MTKVLMNLTSNFNGNYNKIALLHHDIEPTELKFKEFFLEEGCYIDFFDIRKVKAKDLLKYDLIFNRVYSSVASRDYKVLSKTLSLLRSLEKKGIKCINSYFACLVDYNKYELYKTLVKNNINTPKTLFIQSRNKIDSISEEAINIFGFPIVVKRNCGGKSYEVTKVYTKEELLNTLRKMFDLAKEQKYGAGFILQKFIQSSREHDCRVAIVENKFLYSYARSFISRNSEDKWLASTSRGSLEIPYEATPEEIDIAIKANKSIGASFSESDIVMTSEGPYIIEVNPSAGYFVDSIDDLERMKIIVKTLINKHQISNEVYQFNNIISPLIIQK